MQIYNRKEDENNREYAYRTLRKNIMTLQILPGTTINEGEISEGLGISRTPVHEAVIRLKEEMLLEIYPQSGTKVTLIDINILKEGLFLRSVIEPEILIQLAGHVHSDDLDKLKMNLELQKAAVEADHVLDEFFELDDKFHHIIYEMGGKPTIWEAMKKVCTHYDRVRYMDAIMNRTDLNAIYEEHKAIYYYLLLGFPRSFNVREFYETHLEIYKLHFQQIMDEHAAYFFV